MPTVTYEGCTDCCTSDCECDNTTFRLITTVFTNGSCSDCNTTLVNTWDLTKGTGCQWDSTGISFCSKTVVFRLKKLAAHSWVVYLMEGSSIRVTWSFSGDPSSLGGVCSWSSPTFTYTSDDGNGWCAWSGTAVTVA